MYKEKTITWVSQEIKQYVVTTLSWSMHLSPSSEANTYLDILGSFPPMQALNYLYNSHTLGKESTSIQYLLHSVNKYRQ